MSDDHDVAREAAPKWTALEAGDSWDFRWNKDPKCPSCGAEARVSDQEWWHLYEEGEHTVECPICERAFMVSTAVEYRFSTDEQEEI